MSTTGIKEMNMLLERAGLPITAEWGTPITETLVPLLEHLLTRLEKVEEKIEEMLCVQGKKS